MPKKPQFSADPPPPEAEPVGPSELVVVVDETLGAETDDRGGGPRRAVEAWTAAKRPEPSIAAAAMGLRDWLAGTEVTEREYDDALAEAAAQPLTYAPTFRPE